MGNIVIKNAELLYIYRYRYIIESSIIVTHLEVCKGDSGAPLWIEEKKIIAAILVKRDSGQRSLGCGAGWAQAAKLTHPRILSWIKDMLSID